MAFLVSLWDGNGGITKMVKVTHIPEIVVVLFSFLVIPISLLVLWEKYVVRAGRKAKGLDIYKDISADLEQMKIDEMVAKEHKAYVNNGIIKDNVDKNDIGYWFSLFEKGAITKEQFEKKREELLA